MKNMQDTYILALLLRKFRENICWMRWDCDICVVRFCPILARVHCLARARKSQSVGSAPHSPGSEFTLLTTTTTNRHLQVIGASRHDSFFDFSRIEYTDYSG